MASTERAWYRRMTGGPSPVRGADAGRLRTVRTLVGRVVGRASVLKRNRAFFEVQRWRDARVHRPDPSLTSRPELVEALVRDGLAVVPGFADAEQVRSAVDALEPWFERLRSGEVEEEMAVPREEHHYFRLPRVHERVPETRFFFDDPLIHEVAKAYLSRTAAPYRFVAEWRTERRPVISAEDIYHFDSWRPVFKAFLYLTDVTEETSPFAYMKGSHRRGAWSYRRALEFETEGQDGSWGHFFPGEVKRLQRQLGWEEAVVTAPAGTLIFADFSGLHRGSPLLEGRRVLLNCTFGMRSWES